MARKLIPYLLSAVARDYVEESESELVIMYKEWLSEDQFKVKIDKVTEVINEELN